MQGITTILLAAGEGKRMRSTMPKGLHTLCGRPLLDWVLHVAPRDGEPPIAVVGFGAAQIKAHYQDRLRYAEQNDGLGTGRALIAARPYLEGNDGKVLVLAGDLPLLQKESIKRLLRSQAAAAFLSTTLQAPAGHGRVVRVDGKIAAVIEDRDCTRAQAAIQQVRISAYSFDVPPLLKALSMLAQNNPLGELTIADVIGHLLAAEHSVEAIEVDSEEAMGVNDRVELALCTERLRQQINTRHMQAGVTFIDPAATYVDDTVRIGRDCTLYPNVVLEGNTILGEGTTLYPGCRIKDSHIGSGSVAQSVVAADAVVGNQVTMGPYVHLRAGTRLQNFCKVGNYVEVKNSTVGEGSKLPHLSYIGDSDIGKRVNMGCGSVTVNYDGYKKHRTVIGDDAFIGCNTSLVAPVHVGEGAFTAAGSAITEDVPAQTLALARAKQVNKLGYVAKLRVKRGETGGE